MSKIFFDMYPAKGHYHATLKMAALLKKAGHDVTYGVTAEYQKIVDDYGFQYKIWNPFLLIPFKALKIRNEGLFFITNLVNAISGSSLKEAQKRLNNLRFDIHQINPDLVLVDEQNVYKTLIYKLFGINVMIFQTKPDTRRIEGIPPFTSYYLPTFKSYNNIYCNWLWAKKIFNSRIRFYWQKLVYFKQNDLCIYQELAKSFGVNFLKEIEWERSFGKGVKGIPRLIISPKAFDFPHAEIKNVFRIGPLINIKRENRIQNPRYQSLIKKINAYKESGLIIYCSMGTVTGNDLKRYFRFVKKFIKVAVKSPTDLFILSTGKYLNINQMLPLSNNVILFEHLPQIDFLQYCDLMITHGGMNSINECIYNEVPMLVYPLSLKWDQPGNSARVVFHGLGLRRKIDKDSVKNIKNKINQIRLQYQVIKSNISQMKVKFEEQNNSTIIVEIIESQIASHIIKTEIN